MSNNTDPTLLKLFPGVETSLGRGGGEVNGLRIDAVPQGQLQRSGMTERQFDRVFHIVDCNDERFYLRVCRAMPGEGYDAFAVIHARARLGTPAAEQILDDYTNRVNSGYLYELPKGTLPTIGNCAAFVKGLKDVPNGPSDSSFSCAPAP